MNTIFKKLGYQESQDASNAIHLRVIAIHNPDGTPRWIFPANAKRPLFLKFYHVSNARSLVFACFMHLLFFFRLQRLFFRVINLKLSVSDAKSTIIDVQSKSWAIFTGTPGPNNKLIIYSIGPIGGIFHKISQANESNQLVANEVNALNRIFSLQMHTCEIPEVHQADQQIIAQSEVRKSFRNSNRIQQLHLNFLSELYEKTSIQMPLNEVPSYNSALNFLYQKENINARIPKGIVSKLKLLASTLKPEMIEVAMAHGDFTPWNTSIRNSRLMIYDWELSDPLAPIGFDAFHFIIQNGVLIDKKPWKEIKRQIQDTLDEKQFPQWSKTNEADNQIYLRLYLLIHVTRQLELFANQKEWHLQIHWLLQTWNEALSGALREHKNHRELLITDVFDFLHNRMYASLKFPDHSPELLSPYSDIDMCIHKKDALALAKYLQNHPLSFLCKKSELSNMTSVSAFTENGEILSLDLIWKMKRKSLEFIQIENILRNSYVNQYGIKMADQQDLARYIGLFYGLNGAGIPPKYQAYEQLIANSKTKLDQVLHTNYTENKIQKNKLVLALKKEKNNTPLHRLKNYILYIKDLFISGKSNNGMIITFSGVDGAGKSTVISKVKNELEKKLRKKVVVIRHRPSLLPILSAWTKGKKQAEAAATVRLPRQGTNKNVLLSLLRFSYYYVDYLIGQLYVLLAYKSRGVIVLYDRYYFDFIIDSKRSNITLPAWVTKLGYSLLIKPDVNFFLFANAEIILKRKEELDSDTINNLTAHYSDLFRELQSKKTSQDAQYHIIENNELTSTVNSIYQFTLDQMLRA